MNSNRILSVRTFFGGMLVWILAVLPFLFSRRGLFFYYGDYNVQQVPFLIFAHRAVRQGRFFWNPLVDLGGNMGGTFAFYLWGSPFFWLTIPFPESWLPYMMPFLMALKYGFASAGACAWIRTQTRTEWAAVLGGFLYAFSGFQASNIVFQHFHDATAFFPFYLLAADRFVQAFREGDHPFSARRNISGDGREHNPGRRQEGRRVPEKKCAVNRLSALYGFILMTALMAVVNYYFFFGQVLFLILYYLVRWGLRLAKAEGPGALCREVLRILTAGAAGLMLVSFFLVQAVSGILGNTRMSKVLSGYDLVAYPDATTPLAILKSFFMVPDLVARGTLFSNDTIRNGSLAFYLPCFAMAGVFSFWILRRKSWKKALLTICAGMAFVPFLNAAFSAMNANYYARWFYMPILLCACMTAEVLEERESAAFTRGTILSVVCTAVFLLLCFLPVREGDAWSFTSICKNRKLLNVQIRGTLIGAAALLLLLFIKLRFTSLFKMAVFLITVLCCIGTTMAVLHNGSSLISGKGFEKWKRQMLTERPLLDAAKEEAGDSGAGDGADSMGPAGFPGGTPGVDAPFSRVETDSTSTNYEMVWGYPTMHCFESTVHPSIFSWYRGIGMIRTVESTLPLERVGARAVMSVRYYIENTLVKPEKSYTDQGGIKGYFLLNEENGYNVYETENYIPMGFSFDTYMTEENYRLLENSKVSDRVLVKDLILSEEMAEKYGAYMQEDTEIDQEKMADWEFSLYCDERSASACSGFAFDKNGFHATAVMKKDNLLLFSIPYDEGFTVTVDGEPVQVERADFGLTAVFVPEGTHEIRATYLPRGFAPCAVLSGLTALGLLLLLLYKAHYHK